jgi:hypothetical protein
MQKQSKNSKQERTLKPKICIAKPPEQLKTAQVHAAGHKFTNA